MEILKTGQLVNKSNGSIRDYYIRTVDITSLDQLCELDKFVIDNMPRRDLYAGVTREEFIKYLNETGITVAAFVEEELIGFYLVYFPDDEEDNLGLDVGVPENELHLVAHMEATAVHPDYAGNNLLKIMAHICFEEAKKRRAIKHLCITVSPYNYTSIHHIFEFGIFIRCLEYKYGGMLRYVGAGNLEEELEVDLDTRIYASCLDEEKQRKLLKEGYVGYSMEKRRDGNYISYGKPRV